MDGMERTNLTLARILNHAVQSGVHHWALKFEDLDVDQDFETHFRPCLKWPEAEGLIHVGEFGHAMGGQTNGTAFDISLTSRGMALLGQTIELGGKETTVAEQVKERAEGTISTTGIGDFLGALIGGFTKSMNS